MEHLRARKDQVKVKASDSETWSTEKSDTTTKTKSRKSDSDDDKTNHTHDDEDCEEERDCCYWPLIIFIIIFIILLICGGCTSYGGEHKSIGIACLLFFIIVWGLVLWFFCRSGNTFAAWFFLLLAIAVLIIYAIACLLDGLC